MQAVPEYYAYWGKASKQDSAFHRLVWHSLDVAAVADELLRRRDDWCQQWALLADLDRDAARALAVWLIGLHDIGKYAESFQYLRPDLREIFLPGIAVKCKRYSIKHDRLGHILWTEILRQELGRTLPKAYARAVVELLDVWMLSVTGHHPTPVGMNRLAGLITLPSPGVPHARGDEPISIADILNLWVCSPRPWG